MEDDENSQVDDDIPYNEQDQQQQLLELNELFSRFKDDPNNDYVNVNRLMEVLQAFGQNPSLRDAERRISELEAVEKFELTLEDVLAISEEPWTIASNDRNGLRQALEKFDPLREGYIDIEKFRTVMTTLGEPLTDEELDELIQLGLNDEQTKISIDFLLDQLLGMDS